jgi:D-aminopeptidase
MAQHYPGMGIEDDVVLPMVGECDDSFLNDQRGRHVSESDAIAAIETAQSGPVAEGAVGAGTGMVSYRFKGGIGTSSRKLPANMGGYTVGVLSNCNMGAREDLLIDGVPIGREIQDLMPKSKVSEGSVIIVVATDAPLLPHQLQRLARRSAMGLARTGSIASHGSGDFVIAFSTANVVPHYPNERTHTVTALANTHINGLFEAVNECTQEAIGNALTMATTTEGRDGNTAFALPLDRLKAIMKKYGRLNP